MSPPPGELQSLATELVITAASSALLHTALPLKKIKDRQALRQAMWRAPGRCLHGVSWIAQTWQICQGPVPGLQLCVAQKLWKWIHLHRGQVKMEVGTSGPARVDRARKAVICFRWPWIIPSSPWPSSPPPPHQKPPPPPPPYTFQPSGYNFHCFFIKYLKVILLLPGNARLRNISLQKGPSTSKPVLRQWMW